MNRLEPDGTGVILSISHDVTDRRRRERDLERRALTDPLTGMANRTELDAVYPHGRPPEPPPLPSWISTGSSR